MKERLIKWTRNEENEIKLAIATIVLECIVALIMAVKCDWRIINLSFIERIIFAVITLSIFWGFIIIASFFNQEEDTLRNNKIILIIFSNEEIWATFLIFFILPISGIIGSIGYIILGVIFAIVMIFSISKISGTISGFFKKRLK